MLSSQEANILRTRVSAALAAMQRFNKPKFYESEVDFRFDAVVGILIIALADISEMVRTWEKMESENGVANDAN